MPEPMYCVNHPERETLLRCGKCGQPICTECAVRHPVGLRCPQCAKLKKVPIYDVPATYYLRALVAGTVVSLLCAVVAEILPLFVPVMFLSFLLAMVAGAIVGEATSRAAEYKRGRGLQIVAAVSVVAGSIGGTLCVAAFMYGGVALLLTASYLLNPFYWLYPIVAAAVAVTRLR